MNAAAEFEARWLSVLDQQGPELLPYSLSHAARAMLGADGAGLCLFSETLRMPIGASSLDVVAAEEAQTTQGDGPCLEAIHFGVMIVASATRMRQRWPQLADSFDTTPYRSTVSVPIHLNPRLNAALDLYFADPIPAARVNPADAAAVARLVKAALLDTLSTAPAFSDDDPALNPPILTTASARRRAQVWTAVGMVRAALGVDENEALVRLRAHAYATDVTLDDLADDLVNHEADADTLLSDERQPPVG